VLATPTQSPSPSPLILAASETLGQAFRQHPAEHQAADADNNTAPHPTDRRLHFVRNRGPAGTDGMAIDAVAASDGGRSDGAAGHGGQAGTAPRLNVKAGLAVLELDSRP
jgi:hypothetical protein